MIHRPPHRERSLPLWAQSTIAVAGLLLTIVSIAVLLLAGYDPTPSLGAMR